MSELRESITANATALDVAVRYFSGTLSNRSSVVPSPISGDRYYATDAEVEYEWSGSAWGAVMVAGPWVALTLASGVTAASLGYVPSARLEGDTVRFKGWATNSSLGPVSTVGTVPSNMRPAQDAAIVASVGTSPGDGSADGMVVVGGQIDVLVPEGDTIRLDGITYSLS